MRVFHYPTIKLWKNELVKLMSILAANSRIDFVIKYSWGKYLEWHLRTIPTGNRSKKKNSVFSGSDFFL